MRVLIDHRDAPVGHAQRQVLRLREARRVADQHWFSPAVWSPCRRVQVVAPVIDGVEIAEAAEEEAHAALGVHQDTRGQGRRPGRQVLAAGNRAGAPACGKRDFAIAIAQDGPDPLLRVIHPNIDLSVLVEACASQGPPAARDPLAGQVYPALRVHIQRRFQVYDVCLVSGDGLLPDTTGQTAAQGQPEAGACKAGPANPQATITISRETWFRGGQGRVGDGLRRRPAIPLASAHLDRPTGCSHGLPGEPGDARAVGGSDEVQAADISCLIRDSFEVCLPSPLRGGAGGGGRRDSRDPNPPRPARPDEPCHAHDFPRRLKAVKDEGGRRQVLPLGYHPRLETVPGRGDLDR